MAMSSFFCRLILVIVMVGLVGNNTAYHVNDGSPHRILLDTDVDTDDVFALLYILKLDRSIFDLRAITVSANAWTNPGHSVNEVYGLLHMMGRDDVSVGVGGEGGILEDGTILDDVGGYLPIIEQGLSTAGYCRYRQVIPLGAQGKLDADTKFGIKRAFLPKAVRRYKPWHHPTAQQVMIDTISEGPTNVFVTGSNTNLAIFLMSNPELKKNIQHIYVMGGVVNTKVNKGNVYTGYPSTPYSEYNIFSDPFAAYQVIHSGIPVTLVPLDASDTIPMSSAFLEEFEKNQDTYEAQYCYKILNLVRGTWFDNRFSSGSYRKSFKPNTCEKIFYMWDSFLAGVATSIMLKQNNIKGENEFAEMKYKNITVITSNEPYGINDGSNPFAADLKPKLGLKRNDNHSGHVFIQPTDPFCLAKINGCKDGYTKEVSGTEGVRVLVAVKAKLSSNKSSPLDKKYYRHFLDVLNRPQQTGKFNRTTQFPHYRQVVYKPDFKGRKLGMNLVFDMDMSPGDFLTLFYLLKVPVEVINLKAILVTPTGWANAATIDVIYDLLHMMGRDDISVGLGDYFALGQIYPNFTGIGGCNYRKAISHGSGGYVDSDSLYGLKCSLPQGTRSYTAENSIEYGAPRTTDHPNLRQPRALEVWKSVKNSLVSDSKVTILANGPLTTVAQIILSGKNSTLPIQDIVIVGGHLSKGKSDKGNVMNIPKNEYSEMNMFLDPLAAKAVFESSYSITLIPLGVQRKVSNLYRLLESLHFTGNETPELDFVVRLVSRMWWLKETNYRYENVDIFAGEMLGAVLLSGGKNLHLKTRYTTRKVEVLASGKESEYGRIILDEYKGRAVKVLENVDPQAYFTAFSTALGAENQSAVIGSFAEQRKMWSAPPHE